MPSVYQQLLTKLPRDEKRLQGEMGLKLIITFLFCLLIAFPLWLVVFVPITIIYLGGKKIFGKRARRFAPKYLEVSEVAKDMKARDNRQFELVMFGATGFTGKLAAKYIASNYPNLRWAIAGRSQGKLEKVRAELVQINPKLKDLPILIADSSDAENLKKIVNETRVVASTVGPYARFGTYLVALCSQYGTHYCDITGEVAWLRQMIEKYDNLAKKSGAILISCCGCDSIPWDILTYNLAKYMQKSGDSLKRVEHYDFMNGNFSGGTFSTLQFSLNNPPKKSQLGFDPLMKKIGVNEKHTNKFRPIITRFLGYDSKIKKFIGMWALADGNAGIIKRSNALLNYCDSFTYSESLIYPNFLAGFVTQIGYFYMGVLLAVPPLLRCVEKAIFPMPGEGPRQKAMDRAFLTLRSVGTGKNGKKIIGMIKMPNDPGYIDTARMLIETGLSMAFNQNKLMDKGGFQTPSSGVGDILSERLVNTGSTIQVMDSS